jgi:Domain of unknown function (DUF4823)
MRIFFFVLTLLGLAACADTHSVQRINETTRKLSRTEIGYVAVPQDGRYGGTVYAGSGAMTSQIVMAAFSRHLERVTVAGSVQGFDASLAAARQAKASYLISPTILHWEDRATEWSGISDKVSVRISVVDAATGKIIDSAVVDGRSGWATLGGDHPQDLLPEPIGQYADSLF